MSTVRRQSGFLYFLKRDLVLVIRDHVTLVNALIFFLIIVSLFAIAMGPDKNLLQKIAPGVLWVSALLSSTLALDMIFREDYEDGTLEQFMISRQPLSVIVAAKILAHWLISGIPLIVISIFMGLFLYLDKTMMSALLATLCLGTPIFSLLGAVLVALTVGLRNSAGLLSLLILPLYIPILIFSVGAVQNASKGLSIQGELYFLLSLLILAITLAPITAAAAIRIRLG
ncbi:MAG TPA: heme exporter protein CcmB [Gammaproteobacteria bacterium]